MSNDKPGNSGDHSDSTEPAPSGPLDALLPYDQRIWDECRRMVVDRTVRVDDLAAVAAQDPVIVMDLLKVSNAMFFSGGRAPITAVKTAIVRLGSEVVLDVLEKVKDRPQIDDPKVSHWFEIFRSKCRRASIVARILSETLARGLSDDCQAGGLLAYVGEMLAVFCLRDEYVDLAEDNSRSGVNYQLANKHSFDVERMGIEYLRKFGIPEALLLAIDREARSRTPDRALLRPIVFAACEFIEAFDNDRWEKLAPGAKLPPKSTVRMLQLNDNQYLKVYERSSEYLFAMRMAEARQAQAAAQEVEEAQPAVESEPAPVDSGANDLASDIEDLISGRGFDEEEVDVEDESPEPTQPTPTQPKTEIRTVPASLSDPSDQFSLASGAPKSAPRKIEAPKIVVPKLRTSSGTETVESIVDMFEASASSEELLLNLLDMLTKEGPFKQAALIVVSRDRKHAIVVAQRGSQYGNGQRLELDDPLSPLAQCFSKVQSFGNRENKSSPFGSKAFALAPIDADHDTPVALYADCGNKGSLTFESRRVFRNVVSILNQKLPTIPGGIPVEIE